MKFSLSSVIRILAFFNSFLPVCTAICYCFGYKFSLFSYGACSIIFAVLSVAGVIYSLTSKQNLSKKADTAMLAFLPLFSVINWALYLFKSSNKAIITACMPICFVCVTIIAIKYIKPDILKISSILIPSLALFPIAFSTFLLLLPVSVNTVVKTIPSPEGTYYAEITDVDQGALGGDTLVRIHKTKKLDFLLFNITKNPEQVYLGDWKDYENMQIYWINENCIEIDEIEYTVE